MSATLKNMAAQTQLTTEQARKTKVDADNAEHYGSGDVGIGALEWQEKWNKVALQSLEVAGKRISNDMSAAQLAQFNKTKEDLAQEIQNQARSGKINADALQKITDLAGGGGNILFQAAVGILTKILGR